MRAGRTLLLFSLSAALGFGLLGLPRRALRAANADGEDAGRRTLLVKCPASALEDVLRALKGLDVEVHDLETMKRLSVPVAANAIPAPADAVRVMEEMLATLSNVKDKAGKALIRVESMTIQPRRASVRIEAATQADLDAAAKALRKNAFLKRRGGSDALGALERTSAGRFRTMIGYRFDPHAAAGRPPLPPLVELPFSQINLAEQAAGVQNVYASPVQKDPNRRAGYQTIAREFTYAPTSLSVLRKFVRALTRFDGRPNGLTVSELRWKRADLKQQATAPHDLLRKPTLKVAIRTPLP